MRRRVALAAVTLAVTAGAAVPSAAAPRARTGALTGDTTIEWRGTAGIRLRIPGTGSLPEKSMTLYLRGGSYAFVSMLSDPQPSPCGAAHCHGFFLGKFPRAGSFAMDERPGHDHVTNAGTPPDLYGRHLDLYLMTDGVATLRLRPQGYRGRSSYVAVGKVRGLARELPGDCATVCGSTAVGEVAAGGAVFDFGGRRGHLVTHVVSTAPRPGVAGPPYPWNAQTCYYPSLDRPEASADPRDHPYGCDLVPNGADDAGPVAGEAFNALSVGGGSWASWNAGDVTGKRYIGFRAGQAWVEDGANFGYGVWFNYGIR